MEEGVVDFGVVVGEVGVGDVFGTEQVVALPLRRGESHHVLQLSRRFLHDE